MKKLVFSIALFSAVAFVSCCNKESKTDAAQAAAAPVEVVADTVVVDSTAVAPAEVVADSAVVAE